MAQSNLLLLNLDRLPDYTGDAVWLSLTISTALREELAQGEKLDAAALTPWAWNDGRKIERVKLFWDDGNGNWQEKGEFTCEERGKSIDGNDPPTQKLQASLEAKLQDRSISKVLDLGAGTATQGDQPPWPHLLEDAIRLPAPLGQWLNLVLLVKLRRDDFPANGSVVMAPLFTYDNTAWAPSAPVTGGDGIVAIPYEAGPNPRFAGRTTAMATSRPGPDMWTAPPSWGGKDWLAALPLEAGDASDLLVHLVHALQGWLDAERLRKNLEPILTGRQVKALRVAALRLARLGAHSGVGVGGGPTDLALPTSRTAESVVGEYVRRQTKGPDGTKEPPDLPALVGEGGPLGTYEKGADLLQATSSPSELEDRVRAWAKRLEVVLKPQLPEVVRWGASDTQLDEPPAAALGAVLADIRALLGAAARADTLSAIVLEHWRAAWPTGDGAPPEMTKRQAQVLSEAMAGMRLRSRLLLDRLDEPWMEMSKRAGAIDDMRTAFKETLKARALRLLADPEMPTEVKTAIEAEIDQVAAQLGPEIAENENGSGAATKDAQPVSLVLGSLAAVRPLLFAQDDLAVDELRRLAGLGVLLRQRKKDDTYAGWRCLTLAAVEAAADGSEALAVGVAPWRIAVQAGIETRAVSYDDDPLSARGVREKLAESVSQDVDRKDQSPYVRFRQVPGADAAWGKVPGLKFGQRYEVAAFKVASAGALPPELCADGQPTLLDAGKLAGMVPASVARFRYLRRTPVAAPRLVGKDGRTSAHLPLELPAIPVDVTCRAPEILPVPPAGERRRGDPLVLLADDRLFPRAKKSFQCVALPPACPVEVWRRWRAMDLWEQDKPQTELKGQLGAYYASLPKPDGAGGAVTSDPGMPDPAVATLVFRLVELYLDPTSGKPAEKQISQPLDVLGNGTNRTLLERYDVLIEVADRSSPPELQGSSVKVKVERGKIYRFEVISAVEANRYDEGDRRRFALAKPDSEGVEQGLVAAARQSLTIEVATSDMPNTDDLWRAIQVLGTSGDDLAVGIDPAAGAMTEQAKFDHVKVVTLERQRWSWRGRKLQKLPDDPGKGTVPFILEERIDPWNEFRKWDAQAFGDRDDQDRLVAEGVLPRPGRPGRGVPIDRGPILHRIDLGRDARAMYLRYRATAKSRYVGLMADQGRGTTVRTPWRRLLVLNRLRDKLPKPKVRFLLPLTQPTNDPSASGTAAPILLMLEEAWSATAGFVEEIRAELVEAQRTYQVTSLAEIGPDPIDELGPQAIQPTIRVEPPFGLTFEPNARPPLVTTSCHEVVFMGGKGSPVVPPWTMAKVKFKRVATANGSERADSKPNEAVTPESEWTDGFWVQLLPDFRYVEIKGGVQEIESLRFDNRGQLLLADGKTRCPKLREVPEVEKDQPVPTDYYRLRQIAVLVTRLVADAGGQRHSEAYVGMGVYQSGTVDQAGTVDVIKYDDAAEKAFASSKEQLRGRVLEIELHRLGGWIRQPEEVARRLFPADGARDSSLGRIVQISPPFPRQT